jgi:hypothetical protein
LGIARRVVAPHVGPTRLLPCERSPDCRLRDEREVLRLVRRDELVVEGQLAIDRSRQRGLGAQPLHLRETLAQAGAVAGHAAPPRHRRAEPLEEGPGRRALPPPPRVDLLRKRASLVVEARAPAERGRFPSRDAAGAPPEDRALEQAVGPEPVRAVHAAARTLARGEETPHRRAPGREHVPLDVDGEAPHRIVGGRANRESVDRRIKTDQALREPLDLGQAGADALRPEVAKIQPERLFQVAHATAGLDLGVLGARDDVARRELHLVGRVPRHEALALRIDEVTSFASARLAQEHAGRVEPGRVKLQHLQIHGRGSAAQGHGQAVAGVGEGIGVDGPRARVPARREHRARRAQADDAAGSELEREDSFTSFVAAGEAQHDELLVEADTPRKRLLPEGVQEDEARPIRRVDRTRRGVAAEGPLRDPTVRKAAEMAAHVLVGEDDLGRLAAHALHHLRVAQALARLQRVGQV